MTSTVCEACTVISKMSDGTITTEWAIQKVSHARGKAPFVTYSVTTTTFRLRLLVASTVVDDSTWFKVF